MREIKEDLLEIDRMNKLALKAHIKELEEKTDFSWYAEKEFGGDFLENKSPKKQFTGNSLEEIRKGLKQRKEYTLIVYSFFIENNNKICYNKKENNK